MNGVDLGLLGVMGVSCLMGLVRGFTRETLGLLTWLTAGVLTYFFLPLVSFFARGYIANPMIADTLTGICLFISTLILLSLLTTLISGYVRASTLGSIDRSLGLAFGILRAIFLVCVAEMILTAFTPRPSQPPSIQNARFIGLARQGGDTLLAMIPQNWQDSLKTVGGKSGLKKEGSQGVSSQADALLKSSLPEGLPSPEETAKEMAKAFGTIVPQSSLPDGRVVPIPPKSGNSDGQDPEKTAESLANLKPQAVEGGRDEYDPRQKRDMDRLFQTNQHPPSD